jgi:erythromycin esterase
VLTGLLVPFLGCCCCVFTLVPCSAEPASESPAGQGREAVLSWARDQAVALNATVPGGNESDLSPFRKLVGDARIVLLGDSRHDAREQWLLKHRLIEFLVREMGFSVLAIEESLPCTAPLNAFLLGERDDLETVQSQLGAWYIWDTEEFRGLMRALRAHNDSAEGGPPVRLYGFDISEGVRRAVNDALAFLSRSSADTAEQLRRRIDLEPFSENFWVETMGNYGRLTSEATHALGDGLAELVKALRDRHDDLVARDGQAEYEWALRQAVVASRAHEMMVSGTSGSFEEGGAIREAAMANNLAWLMRTVAPDERIIVWAHNFHVSRAPLDIEIPGRPAAEGMEPLGHLLARDFGDSMVSIGFSFERGLDPAQLAAAPESWVDGLLADVGPDAFLLDLRSAPSDDPVRGWLSERQTMRGQGGRSTVVPRSSFDALVFVRELGRTTPTESARERFASLGWQ